MRVSFVFPLVVLANVAIASTWFSSPRAVYNKWHQTELERWLSDHNIPYPTPADRRDLEKLVSDAWTQYVVQPYESWSTEELTSYLARKSGDAKDYAGASRDSLVAQVRSTWTDTENASGDAYGSVKNWIFDTWTDSQLKAYCDYHGIPVPQPRDRDSLLQKVRSSYETVAQKTGDYAAYPGDWLYSTWSDSELTEWLREHGYKAPQPNSRDKLVASVRRQSRLAYVQMQDKQASMSSSAASTYQTLTDMVIDAWGDSQLKEFCDKNGINVPQGSRANEMRALVRKHRAKILGDSASATVASAYGAASGSASSVYGAASGSASSVYGAASGSASSVYGAASGSAASVVNAASDSAASAYGAASGSASSIYGAAGGSAGSVYDAATGSAASAYGAATSRAGNEAARASDSVVMMFDSAVGSWSDSRLKAYLEARGVPVPQGSKTDSLRALVRKNAHTAGKQWNSYSFDDYSPQQLKDYLAAHGDAKARKAAQKTSATRDDLVRAAQAALSSASASGGSGYASATSYLSQQTDAARSNAFDTWSESDLKAYLDSYGVPVPQPNTLDSLRAEVRKQHTYFKYGASSPPGAMLARLSNAVSNGWQWVKHQVAFGADTAEQKADDAKHTADQAKAKADQAKEKADQKRAEL